MSTTPAVPSGVTCTVAVLLFGALANVLVFGATSIKSYHYYKDSHGDNWIMKCMVALLWFINVLQVAFDVAAVDHYILKNYANYLAFEELHWTLAAVTFLVVIGSALIRVLLAQLIWKISKGRWALRIPAMVFCALSLLTGVALGVETVTDGTIQGTTTVEWLVYATFGTAIVCDIVIAGSLCYLLTQVQTGRKRVDSVLHVLGMYFVNSGVVITVCNIASIISFAIMRHNCVYMAIFFFSFSFYFLSLLSTLTSRGDLRARMGGVVTTLPMVGLNHRSPQSSTCVFGRPMPKNEDFNHLGAISVTIETETQVVVDGCDGEQKYLSSHTLEQERPNILKL